MTLKTIQTTAAHAVAALALVSAAAALPADAQTVTVTSSNATVIRGGVYANSNAAADPLLATRASDDATYVRKILLKFDTQNTIPAKTRIASAALTLTVAGGNAESRQIGAYRIASSYEETQTTWKRRNTSAAWGRQGGDLAEGYDLRTVTAIAGKRVTFNVTQLVQGAVDGKFGSRYSRIALVDTGASSRDSYKEYYSDEAGDASVRPRLVVTLGTATAPAPEEPPAPTGTAVTMRVLQWNLHHGVGTDGKYDIDRIATWMAKMKPDVITLNEVEKNTGWGNENQPERYRALMEAKTGRKWYSVFAQEFGQWTANGKGHLILSTYPLESTALLDVTYDRAVGEARIVVHGRTVSLIVTHLDPESTTRRLLQAKQVTGWATGIAENRILTGDMNAWPDQTSIAQFNQTYDDSWTLAEEKHKAEPVSGISPSGATKKGRIDYILVSKKAANLVVLGSKVYDTRDSRGVMPSDHRPVLTTFEVR